MNFSVDLKLKEANNLTMKKNLFVSLFAIILMFSAQAEDDLKAKFKVGNLEIKAMNALDFGPEGILFIGDSENGKVFALDTKDSKANAEAADFNISSIDQKVAELLGTTPENMTISDLAVNPISKSVYLAVTHTNGSSVLVKIEDNEQMSVVDLSQASFDEQSLEDAVAVDAKDRRGRSLRKWAISDLNYSNGKVMLTGLSNKEFGSTFRAMPFPFDGDQKMSSLEIYHAAHGQYETDSPIKAFTTATMAGKDYVVASYTCTPLVIFPASDLRAGEHVKGRTVAELGNWNTPLDMIVMQKDGASYLLMANSARSVMKIKLENIENFSGSLTERVEERSGTAGVDFIALPFVNVLQLDQLDDKRFVMLQRKADGNLQLWTANNRWL